MSDESKPCDAACTARTINYHRRHLPEALAAGGVYPEIVAYLNECHADIINLRKELARAKELADKRKERLHRYLDLTDDDWYKQRDAIDAAKSERDQAREIAVTLEQQNARALELLRRLNPERRELLEVIAVLAGDDA